MGEKEDKSQKNGINEEIHMVRVLTPDEVTVIKMRFGIIGNREYSREEIGRQLSLTPEVVGEIEKAALRKLRQPVMIRQLQELAMRPYQS